MFYKLMELTAPIIIWDRLRMQTDGQGITTLVCFHGCPLRCHWCINAFSFAPGTKRTYMTPQQLYDQLRVDNLYFMATGGGITFGGGEPLLYAPFLQKFRLLCGAHWHLCAETSLNVEWKNVEIAAQCIDMFYIDCKDTAPEIYRRYTGKSNENVLENLQKLLHLVGPERIVIRLPLIPDFNTEEDRQKSHRLLEEMGITQFDPFTYRTSNSLL